ncbi:uncharacterized protein BDR25DRAFT_383992, partial [Lindgomyces ingoldianus]
SHYNSAYTTPSTALLPSPSPSPQPTSSSHFKPSDCVIAGIIYHPCGSCPNCLGPEHYSQYCAHGMRYCGVTTDGVFTEYARINASQAARLSERVNSKMAAPLAYAGMLSGAESCKRI